MVLVVPSVLSNRSQSRQMATLPGFFPLKGNFFSFHCHLVHTQSRGLDQREVLSQSKLDQFGLWLYYNEFEFNWLEFGCIFECLEMTFVAIWFYINKTELNWGLFFATILSSQSMVTSECLENTHTNAHSLFYSHSFPIAVLQKKYFQPGWIMWWFGSCTKITLGLAWQSFFVILFHHLMSH